MIARPKTYQNYIPPDSGKEYQITANPNGTSKITDVTQYLTTGDTWGAGDANQVWTAILGTAPAIYLLTIPADGWTGTGPYTYSVPNLILSATQRADLFADLANTELIPSAIVPVNENGVLTLATNTAPDSEITIQISVIDTQGVI